MLERGRPSVSITEHHHDVSSLLHINDTAVDLHRVAKPNRSTIYEDICFEEMARTHTDHIALGPYLIDSTLNIPHSFAGLIRPDAMLFLPDGDTWTLTRLAEFKSGKRNGSKRKLEGFSYLLERLRRQPDILLERLANQLGEGIDMPARLDFPDDSLVTVTFMSQIPGSLIYTNGIRFRVEHVFVPLTNSELRKRRKTG